MLGVWLQFRTVARVFQQRRADRAPVFLRQPNTGAVTREGDASARAVREGTSRDLPFGDRAPRGNPPRIREGGDRLPVRGSRGLEEQNSSLPRSSSGHDHRRVRGCVRGRHSADASKARRIASHAPRDA